MAAENLGEILLGDSIENSLYDVRYRPQIDPQRVTQRLLLHLCSEVWRRLRTVAGLIQCRMKVNVSCAMLCERMLGEEDRLLWQVKLQVVSCLDMYKRQHARQMCG